PLCDDALGHIRAHRTRAASHLWREEEAHTGKVQILLEGGNWLRREQGRNVPLAKIHRLKLGEGPVGSRGAVCPAGHAVDGRVVVTYEVSVGGVLEIALDDAALTCCPYEAGPRVVRGYDVSGATVRNDD